MRFVCNVYILFVKKFWKSLMELLEYNSSFYLLYGRLSVYMLLKLHSDQYNYGMKWKGGMKEAYPNQNSQKADERRKRYYDVKVKSSEIGQEDLEIGH